MGYDKKRVAIAVTVIIAVLIALMVIFSIIFISNSDEMPGNVDREGGSTYNRAILNEAFGDTVIVDEMDVGGYFIWCTLR